MSSDPRLDAARRHESVTKNDGFKLMKPDYKVYKNDSRLTYRFIHRQMWKAERW